jgi:DNA polymerase IV
MISFVKIFKKMKGGVKDFKPLIIKIFSKLLEYYEVSTSSTNAFRVLAYRRALNNLKKYNGEINDIDDMKKLDLGKKSVEKIKVIMNTGSLPIYDKIIGDKKIEALIAFQKIIGVGPKKAKEWLNEGIMSIGDLKKSRIKLTDNQKMGLKYYKDLSIRIKRKEIEEIARIIKKKIGKRLKLNIVGSYRLGKETSGDIDIIITYPDKGIAGNGMINITYMDILLEQLNKYILHIISESDNKSLLIVKFPRKHAMRMDLVCIPESQLPWYSLYFGSDVAFSRKIRDCASKKGYKLNEKGLFDKKTGKKVSIRVRKEEDIFKYLGLNYIKPENRLDLQLKC